MINVSSKLQHNGCKTVGRVCDKKSSDRKLPFFLKSLQSKGDKFLQARGVESLILYLAKLQDLINLSTNFKNNGSETVGVFNTKLQVLCK